MLPLLLLGQLAIAQPPLPPPPQRYTLSVLTTEEGLPQNSVLSIAIDDDGFMWLTTWGGPVRFDGLRFALEGEALPNRQTTSVVRSAAGGVLVATYGEGVWRIEGEQVKRVDAPGALPGSVVFSVTEDAGGRVWVGSIGAVTRLDADGSASTARTWTELAPPAEGVVRSVYPASHGGVWVVSTDEVPCRITDGGEVRCADRPRPRGEATIVQALEARDGSLWTVWSDGQVLRIGRDGEARPAFCAGRDPCVPPSPSVAMAEDRHGRLWIATYGSIEVLSDSGIFTIDGDDGLPVAHPRTVFEGPEGGMWVGLEAQGLVHLRPARVRMHGFQRESVSSIAPHPSGGVVAASPCGLLRVLPDGTQRCEDILEGMDFRFLYATGDGRFWLGTVSDGLFLWDESSGAEYIGFAEENMRALQVDSRGDLWIGTVSGVHRLRAAAPGGRVIERIAGPGDDRFGLVSSFAEDREGRMWIGSNGGGLSVFEDDSLRWVGPGNGLTSVQIAVLHVDSEGGLWVGTSDRGLFRRSGESFQAFDASAGLPDRTVTQIVRDEGGNLWVGTNRGIARLPREDVEAFTRGELDRMNVITVDRFDGMWSGETSGGGFHPSGLATEDGSLWFSTVSGMASVDLATFRMNALPPVVRVTGYRIEQGPVRRLDAGSAVEVEPGAPSFEVQYTAVGFSNPDRMRFRYRLVGFQDGWVDADTRRVAYYTRMKPGRYTFEVEATNNDGVWSPVPATVSVEVRPFFWETRTFLIAMMASLVMGSVGTGQWWAARHAQRRLDRLEREQALARERSRIARDLHDDLGAHLTRIALLADLGDAGGSSGPRLGDVARNAAVAMDELVWAIDARNDTVHDLAEYAAHFAEQLLQPAAITSTIRLPPHLPRWPIGARARRGIFLVFKEIVNNAVKHSGAGEVEISFGTEPGWFRFSVADDGRGFDPGAVGRAGSSGLRNMEERIAEVGGRIAVESRVGEGTRVEVWIPVEEPTGHGGGG